MSVPLPSGEALFAGLSAAAFLAGGIANATGHRAIRDSFTHLGFPAWWNRPTAALEILTALLLIAPETRPAGLLLGAAIMLVAIAAILRARLPAKLPPPIGFLVLLGLAALANHS